MNRLRWMAMGILGVALVGCAEIEPLKSPTSGGTNSGSGGTGKTNTTTSNGGSAPTGSGGTTARGGTPSTTTSQAGAIARGGASTTTTPFGSGGVYTPPTPTCTDKLKNGEETDVDCGGTCETKCALGKACAADADCTVAICAAGICTTCKNAIKDGDESDVDCGGSCPRCAEGQVCTKVADCATYNCDAATLLCGPMTNCLAAVSATCACDKKVVNASDAVGCQKVIDCLLTNSCGPTDACAASNDAVCGNNTLGVDAGKSNAAKAVYTCACAGP